MNGESSGISQADLLRALRELSNQMNQAIAAKDLQAIEAIHQKKQQILDTINLLMASRVIQRNPDEVTRNS